MWFDVAAALAEIEGGAEPAPKARPPATSATIATQAPDARPVSQLSQVSQAPEAETAGRVANVASVATPSATNEAEAFRHGRSIAGHPLTWTGRVVSLDAWRQLTEWERHGPDGRMWCGCCRAWVARETALAHADALRAEWARQKKGKGDG